MLRTALEKTINRSDGRLELFVSATRYHEPFPSKAFRHIHGLEEITQLRPMVNSLKIIKRLDVSTPTLSSQREKPKSRRQRRAEAKANLKAVKFNQKKAG